MSGFWGVQVVGGLAVLGSYVYGALAHPELADALWGGVPRAVVPAYVVNMFLAAAGYLVHLRTAQRLTELRPGITLCYATVLVPSALWLPLTQAYLLAPSAALLLAVRITLLLVGLGTLALLRTVYRAAPNARAAHVGGFFFAVQTVVLDGLVWNALFPGP